MLTLGPEGTYSHRAARSVAADDDIEGNHLCAPIGPLADRFDDRSTHLAPLASQPIVLGRRQCPTKFSFVLCERAAARFSGRGRQRFLPVGRFGHLAVEVSSRLNL